MRSTLPTYSPAVAADPSPPPDRPSRTSWRRQLTDRDSFVPVLALALLSIVLFPITDAFRWGGIVAFPVSAALVLAALHRSKVRPATMRAAVVVLVVVGVGTVLSSLARIADIGEDRYLVALSSFLYALLYAVAFPAIVRRSFQHRRVTTNTLYAGISAYLIIGIWFGAIFRGISALENYQFFDKVASPRVGDYIYFSFETLTTLGYGDLAPVSDAGRTFAILEAILGQIFLVTAVARIVSLLGSDRSAMELPGEPELDPVDTD